MTDLSAASEEWILTTGLYFPVRDGRVAECEGLDINVELKEVRLRPTGWIEGPFRLGDGWQIFHADGTVALRGPAWVGDGSMLSDEATR
jgi:hypothetical protein